MAAHHPQADEDAPIPSLATQLLVEESEVLDRDDPASQLRMRREFPHVERLGLRLLRWWDERRRWRRQRRSGEVWVGYKRQHDVFALLETLAHVHVFYQLSRTEVFIRSDHFQHLDAENG